jgi:hypothetical protein
MKTARDSRAKLEGAVVPAVLKPVSFWKGLEAEPVLVRALTL